MKAYGADVPVNSYKLALADRVREAGMRLAGDPVAVDDLDPWAYQGQTSPSSFEHSIYDGGKFDGGFGPTQIQHVDYWTLRARSAQVFNDNHYARGIIRRLVTNIINTGLTPESSPEEEILGLPSDSLNDWTEDVETRFNLWGKLPHVCDWQKEKTFGAIQRAAYQEAIVCGDVLVVLRTNPATKLPMVQLVSGGAVQTPFGGVPALRTGHDVQHGVERDSMGRTVAFWVRQADGSFKRLPARGEKSGRRLAWLVFGSDKRLDDVRGQPLLAIVLQSLKEIDRYRDSTQRKAVINSFLALFIKKGSDKMGTLPFTGGAVRRGSTEASDGTTGGEPRRFNAASFIPGMVIDELQEGEEPVLKGGEGTDLSFAPFEAAVLNSIAWCLELPPEIVKLSFANNYSASQAAINEVKIAINLKWGDWGETFCTPIYDDWLISETLRGRVDAPGLLQAWRDPGKQDLFAAWTSVDWYGSIKPSTDIVKQARGSKMLLDEGLTTHARESRVLTGTKFSKNMKRLKRENELKAEAMRPLLELQKEYGAQPTQGVAQALSDSVADALNDWTEDQNSG